MSEMDYKKHFREFESVGDQEGESTDANLLNLFDENNPDISLFNLIDEEIIGLGGSEFYVYKYEIDGATTDDLYGEDRLKKYFNKTLVRGHYEPLAIQEDLGEFGIQLTNDQTFTFNKAYIESKLGRNLHAGDAIQPRFQNIMFEVFEVQEDAFQSYGVYHLVASAKVRRDLESLIDESIPLG